MSKYKIVRYYHPSTVKSPRTIKKGLTLSQAHCNDPKTSTPKYFDGYTQQ